MRCRGCGRAFPQADPRVLDLWLRDAEAPAPGWAERQAEMVRAYRELAADAAHTRLAYANDFGPYRSLLADVSGPVLDLGGGNGLIRDFLPPALEYVSLDPSLEWLDAAWQAAADAFPSLAEPAFLVRGVGERLPFRNGAFGTALSFWSLNHSSDPARVAAEVRRVLRPGGRFFLVLDDVPPRWSEIAAGAYRDPRFPTRTSAAWARLSGWPVQPDHLPITERALARWLRGRFATSRRSWVGTYLTLDLAAV